MRKLRITISVFLVIVGIGILMLVLSKDSVVISIGIRSYRGFYQGGLIAEAALVVLLLILSLRDARKKNAAKKEERENQLREREQSAGRKKLEADLPVNGRLTDVKVRELLKENASGKWKALQDAIGGLVAQMRQMDSYQERLANLLTSNQASTLGDTEEVLDQVEHGLRSRFTGGRCGAGEADRRVPGRKSGAAHANEGIRVCADGISEQTGGFLPGHLFSGALQEADTGFDKGGLV